MMKKQKSEKGITLIALVITIIILLILAGISISQLSGSGLFEKARQAEEKSKNAQAEENSILSSYEQWMENYLGEDSNKPTEITWTMNEMTGEITGGGKTLHVGDYVNYQTKVTNATTDELTALNTQLDTYSGHSTTHALANEPLEWRILDVKDGQLRLISATPTTKTVSTNKIGLKAADGYNNAVYLIDNACNTLYNSSYASKVQNLKIEDIEKHLTYDYTQYVNSTTNTKYEETQECTDNRYYPNIFAKEKKGWVDETPGTELGLSEQKELITGSKQASNKIKVTQTRWLKTMESSDFKNPIYYTLFINNGSNYSTYWMSSRCVYGGSSRAYFFVRCVNSGDVRTNDLYYSDGDTSSYSSAFRPVITLRSNVLIGEGNGSTVPYEINM